MPHCVPLSACNTEQIATCLNLAFSDYAIPVSLSPEELSIYLHNRGANLELSYAAVADTGELVGLLVHALGEYRNTHAACALLAGVVPTSRSQGIFTQLYNHALPLLRAQGVMSYYLDVLQQNERARRLYERIGLQRLRDLIILQAAQHDADELPPSPPDAHQPLYEPQHCDWETWQQRRIQLHAPAGLLPVFESCDTFLNRTPARYRAVYLCNDQKQLSAWCVYDTRGVLMQLGYNNAPSLRQLLTQLRHEHRTLRTVNFDEAASEPLDLLRALGFVERARQYEMGISYE